jgi:hypothetical protein
MADEYVRYVYVADASQVVSANAQVESSARRADAAMLQGVQANKAAMAQLDVQMASLKQQKAALGVEIANIISEVGRESDAYIEQAKDAAILDAEIRKLAADKAALSAETKVLQANFAQTGNEAELTAAKMVRTANAASNIAGVSLGAGRSLAILASAFSAVGLAQVALIAGIGILIGYIMEQIKAKRELIAVNEQGLQFDLAQERTYKNQQNLTKDLQSILLSYKAAREEYLKTLQQEDEGFHKVKASQEEWKKINDANNYGTALATTYAHLFGTALDQVEDKQKKLTNTRMQDTAEMSNAIDEAVKFSAATNTANERIIEQARNAGWDAQSLDALAAALNAATTAESRMAQGHTELGRIRREVAYNAAVATEKLTHAEFERRVQEAATAAGTKDLIKQTELYDENMKAATQTVKSHTGAIRAYNNELINLKKQLEDARAAADPLAGSFEKQAQKIRDNIDALQKHAVANARDRAEMRETIKELGEAQLAALAVKRLEFERKVDDEITQMRIKAIEDVNQREVAQIQNTMQKKIEEVQKTVGFTAEAWDQIVRIAQAADDEMGRHYIDSTRKAAEESMKVVLEVQKQQGALVLKEAGDNLKEQSKQFEIHERQIAQLAAAFASARGGVAPVMDVGQLDRINEKLIQMGASMSQVDRIFGSASKSAQQLEGRIDLLTQKGISGFGELKAVTEDFMKSLIQSGKLYEMLGGIISNMFESIASGTTSFGKALLKAFLDAIAQIATMLGTLFLLAAAGLPFIPGMGWAAAPLIAAGLALMAFAGAIKGLSSLIDKGSSGAAGAAGGSTATGGAAAAGGSARAQNPVLVPINASGLQQAPVQLTVSLDRQSGNDFLAGKDVVTGATVAGKHAKAIRQQARNAMKRAS